MIALWGLAGDGPLDAVADELDRLGAPVFFLDQARTPATELEFRVGPALSGALRVGPNVVALDAITAWYVRPHDASTAGDRWRLAGADDDHLRAVGDALAAWTEITPALVVNRLSAMAVNTSKPYQLRRIAELGFAVPPTVVTTDPLTVQEFWRARGEVVYKSASGIRSTVARLSSAHAERWADLSTSPTQFQQRIVGTDVRVHVVGERTFAVEVLSDADDYRAPGAPMPSVRPTELPPPLAARCVDAARTMGLHVAGVDLRRTRDGDWFCFEVNPSPAFTFYERAAGQPIAAAIARLLSEARSIPPRR